MSESASPTPHPLTAQEREQQLFKASCPSLRQVLAEFSLPPSLRAPLTPSTRSLLLSQQHTHFPPRLPEASAALPPPPGDKPPRGGFLEGWQSPPAPRGHPSGQPLKPGPHQGASCSEARPERQGQETGLTLSLGPVGSVLTALPQATRVAAAPLPSRAQQPAEGYVPIHWALKSGWVGEEGRQKERKCYSHQEEIVGAGRGN